jgi:DegV family protein with EDD domain
MNDYVIFTDSSCDLSIEEATKRGLVCLPLTFRFADEDKEYANYDMPISAFYERVKAGGVAKTAAINTESFAECFRGVLEGGSDAIYLGLSSGLSTTYNSARLAAAEVLAEYPERKIIIVDCLAASAGVALLIDLLLEKKASGADIEETAAYAEEMKLHIAHWFTVDDLVYLKRGGRVSPTVAFVGNLLGIKPILHVDNEGHLTSVSKSRGRHASLLALADKLGSTIKKDSKVYISHGNCIEDAKKLSEIIEEKYGYKTQLITDVGPVIGAHSGPGTLALFFVASER